jgi:cellulose synthase/poly-beta-1,6-N-acetylglucosamine synthase-like glycosyltransferase
VSIHTKTTMLESLTILLSLPFLLLALPALAQLLLTVAALRHPPGQRHPKRGDKGSLRPAVAALVPAHNESIHLLPTLASLQAQLGPQDRLLVVADNCSDDTAAVARQAGAEVAERHDPSRRGKGYALAFGIDQLRHDPPALVLVVDADCTLTPGALEQAAALASQTGNPVQMLYLMHASAAGGRRARLLEFAWRVKNLVRPLGADRLGRACHLTGSGMLFPWDAIAPAELASGHITEDMKLGIDLALAGRPAQLCLSAQVDSDFPADQAATRTQKTRWEHGHLATLGAELPRLLRAWVARPDARLAVLALDLLIPPLALYLLLLGAAFALTLAGALLWPALAPLAWLNGAALLALGLAVLLAWWQFGRDLLQARELLATPLYALRKLPLYLAYAVGRRSGWVRTRRDS